jgi:AcrR family transcriptional regulator
VPTASRQAPAKRAYHHGDLRRALIQAAWRLVRDQGVDTLTLREVARKVGVTHAAPYHHFESREALLEVLADEAFAAMSDEMAEAAAGVTDPSERLFVVGRAYVDHARARPEHVQVMFRRYPGMKDQSPDSPGSRAFAHLFEAVLACQEAGLAPSGDPWQLALSAWSLVHGFVKLWADGPLDCIPAYAENFDTMRDHMLRTFGASWRALAQQERASAAR